MQIRTIIAILLFVLLPIVPARGQQKDKKAEEEERQSSGGGFGLSWVTNSKFPKESYNPNEKVQVRLRVQWEKPVLGYRTIGIVRGDAPVTFTQTDESTPNTGIAISGTLLIESEDGKSSKPIDWFQGVRVLIAREPKSHPDWSKPKDQDNTAWNDCIIEKEGKFTAFFGASEIRRSVGRAEDFQVGLTLGSKFRQTVSWKDKTPTLPQSVTVLSITGPKALTPNMQILNASPSISSMDEFNPVPLVKAVNHLQELGKEKAIAELRAFMEMARFGFMTKRDPANIDTSDNQSLLLVAQLLFEPAVAKQPRPEIRIGLTVTPDKQDQGFWPVFPLGLQDDFPFLMGSWIILAGMPTQPEWLVDWAEKNAKLRAKPLRPPDDPLGAADAYMALPHVKKLLSPGFGAGPRGQAWQAIAVIVKQHEKVPATINFNSDAEWTELKKSAAKLKIRWSEREQKYVSQPQ
jgi:hypothetical protein